MMNPKFFLLLLSTVSLTVSTPSLVRGQTPAQSPLEAPTVESTPPAATPQPEANEAGIDPEQAALLDALNLTDEQKNQFQDIQTLFQAQTKSILTPGQVQQVESLRAAGQKPDFQKLNLSSEQRDKIKEAEGLANYRFALLLTPEQRKELSKIIKKSNN